MQVVVVNGVDRGREREYGEVCCELDATDQTLGEGDRLDGEVSWIIDGGTSEGHVDVVKPEMWLLSVILSSRDVGLICVTVLSEVFPMCSSTVRLGAVLILGLGASNKHGNIQ